jgi:hypothetical protein
MNSPGKRMSRGSCSCSVLDATIGLSHRQHHIRCVNLTVRCRHLIADHIGWFKESTEEGKLRTVEDLLRARGEKVTRGTLGSDGVVEYAPE